MTYRHILFATDLTPQSQVVGERACALADQYQATLDILHVVENSPLTYGAAFTLPFELHHSNHSESPAHRALAQQAHALKIKEPHRHLRSGSVKIIVLQVAQEIKADLILIGTHGPQRLSALLGSRANAILHGASCDVLTVRCLL